MVTAHRSFQLERKALPLSLSEDGSVANIKKESLQNGLFSQCFFCSNYKPPHSLALKIFKLNLVFFYYYLTIFHFETIDQCLTPQALKSFLLQWMGTSTETHNWAQSGRPWNTQSPIRCHHQIPPLMGHGALQKS